MTRPVYVVTPREIDHSKPIDKEAEAQFWKSIDESGVKYPTLIVDGTNLHKRLYGEVIQN